MGDPCTQEFAGGYIITAGDGTIRSVPTITNSAVNTLYQELGGVAGTLGYPIGGTTAVFDSNGNGFAQQFEHGFIHSSAQGTFATSNATMTEFSSRGWIRGSLGWPAGIEVCDAGGCTQDFQFGMIDTH